MYIVNMRELKWIYIAYMCNNLGKPGPMICPNMSQDMSQTVPSLELQSQAGPKCILWRSGVYKCEAMFSLSNAGQIM